MLMSSTRHLRTTAMSAVLSDDRQPTWLCADEHCISRQYVANWQGEMMTCQIEGCGKDAHSKGMCRPHYDRMRRYGRAEPEHTCQIEGCQNAFYGRDYCKPHYFQMWRTGAFSSDRCSVEDCGKPIHAQGYCVNHYSRLCKFGNATEPLRQAPNGSFSPNADGYLLAWMPFHPLAMKNGKVTVHRMALYEKIGAGNHPCHHCGKVLDWHSEYRATKLTVDHLDWNRKNNDPANLVPSCFGCNFKRQESRAA